MPRGKGGESSSCGVTWSTSTWNAAKKAYDVEYHSCSGTLRHSGSHTCSSCSATSST